jgi:hypothetical protein
MVTKHDIQNEAISGSVTSNSQDNKKWGGGRERIEIILFRNKTNRFGYSFEIQYMSHWLELMIEVKRKGKRIR